MFQSNSPKQEVRTKLFTITSPGQVTQVEAQDLFEARELGAEIFGIEHENVHVLKIEEVALTSIESVTTRVGSLVVQINDPEERKGDRETEVPSIEVRWSDGEEELVWLTWAEARELAQAILSAEETARCG